MGGNKFAALGDFDKRDQAEAQAALNDPQHDRYVQAPPC